jgi:hypothetical protein
MVPPSVVRYEHSAKYQYEAAPDRDERIEQAVQITQKSDTSGTIQNITKY